ncbi:MAG: YcfL family protein [Planctomycetota bacterium]|jgi:uncharacterized protein YcfL|nr:YcfL family protein [Planctomycetota bacterium]MDP6763294.1 YcfL family protein [Planctomycetota bacterium]MDP6987972.1 YcfL family protein [Planctomycetota bacterium]
MKHLLSATAILAAAAACATPPVNTVEPAPPQPAGREVWITKINKSSTLEHSVAVQRALVDESEGVLRVQLEVANESESAQDFRYLFEWFDGEGLKLYEATEGWRRETIAPGQHQYLRASASSPEAADWRFTVQKWSR